MPFTFNLCYVFNVNLLFFMNYLWSFLRLSRLISPKYGDKAKLCYMDTDSLIVYINTNYNYKDIAEDVETKLDTSDYE